MEFVSKQKYKTKGKNSFKIEILNDKLQYDM